MITASGISWNLAKPRYLETFLFGIQPLSDGRGTLQTYIDGESSVREFTPISVSQGTSWLSSVEEISKKILQNDGGGVTAFAFRDRLVNTNSVQLSQINDAPHRPWPMVGIAPEVTGESVEGYKKWLLSGDASQACLVLSATGNNFYDFSPLVNMSKMDQAIQELGFIKVDQFELPSKRVVNFFIRNSLCRVNLMKAVKDIQLGDTFGKVSSISNQSLFIHPGIDTATTFMILAKELLGGSAQKKINIRGLMSPLLENKQIAFGEAEVKVKIALNGIEILSKLVNLKNSFDLSLTLKESDKLEIYVDSNGNVNNDWFNLSLI